MGQDILDIQKYPVSDSVPDPFENNNRNPDADSAFDLD